MRSATPPLQRVALFVVAALAFVSAGCGKPELPVSSSGPLSQCQVDDDGEARTWTCGDLIALELAAAPASEAEARVVLEKFASDFAETRAARTDARWMLGGESFPSVRLEGTTADGQRFMAQMVVISRPGGARVVQCASKSPKSPCEPVLHHLIGDGGAGSRPDAPPQ